MKPGVMRILSRIDNHRQPAPRQVDYPSPPQRQRQAETKLLPLQSCALRQSAYPRQLVRTLQRTDQALTLRALY